MYITHKIDLKPYESKNPVGPMSLPVINRVLLYTGFINIANILFGNSVFSTENKRYLFVLISIYHFHHYNYFRNMFNAHFHA
jgi:hypothetical protein